jgi:hypothetical protein
MPIKPIVLVAATHGNKSVADYVGDRIAQLCKDNDLGLQVGPSTTSKTFENKEELFSCLRELGPMQLVHTLVIFHTGVYPGECFAPKIPSRNSEWHAGTTSTLGAALELVLKFPHLFPVFVGPGHEDLRMFLNDLERLEPGVGSKSITMLEGWHQLHFVDEIMNISGLEAVLRRFALGLRTMFDPTGLRTLLRNQFIGHVFGKPGDWSNSRPARQCLASRLQNLVVVVDEEPEIASFAAYSAYKSGARSWMITTYQGLLDPESPTWRDSKTENLWLFRDLDLRFPDYAEDPNRKDDKTPLRTQLKDIASQFWKDLHLPPRTEVRVISYDSCVLESKPSWHLENLRLGQEKLRADEHGLQQATNAFQRTQPQRPEGSAQTADRQACECHYWGLRKPLRSIYAVRSLFGKTTLGTSTVLSGLPIPEGLGKGEGTAKDHHAAPYHNLKLSWDLLEQAEECRGHSDVESSITRAFLAQEAYSLLLGMSQTSSLRALREMALAEAIAEGESAGVSHALEIDDRRMDLGSTVANLNLNDEGANFLAKVWALLRAVYKETEQFEASEEANAESLVYSQWVPAAFRRSERVHLLWLKRTLLKPLRSPYWLMALLVIWPLALTPLHAWAYGWTFAPSWAGVWGFIDLYRHVLNSIIRPEVMKVHEIDVAVHENIFKALLDTVMAASSLIFVGLVVTVLFRKSTRG